MEVPVTELRAAPQRLAQTEYAPEKRSSSPTGECRVARLLGMSATGTLQRLAADGVIGRDVLGPSAVGHRPRQAPPAASRV